MVENRSKEEDNVLNTWMKSYIAVSKMWEDSYLKIYKPWLESTGELFEKAAELSRDATPGKYKEFYDHWLKAYQQNYKVPTPTLETNRQSLERFLLSAEESSKIYRTWIAELEENSKKTKEILNAEPDTTKYKEVYDIWIKSYGKIFDELLALPLRSNIKEVFENTTGIPDIYSDALVNISKLWKDSYTNLYGPWTEYLTKLSQKSDEISKGKGGPEDYKEFYDLWVKTYQETYGKLFDVNTSKNVLENFVRSTEVYVNLYKSWIATLEKLSAKAKESKENSNPEIFRELYSLWIKVYEKSLDIFFENTPTVRPFKNFLEPVKNAVKMYTDILVKATEFWAKPYSA